MDDPDVIEKHLAKCARDTDSNVKQMKVKVSVNDDDDFTWSWTVTDKESFFPALNQFMTITK